MKQRDHYAENEFLKISLITYIDIYLSKYIKVRDSPTVQKKKKKK